MDAREDRLSQLNRNTLRRRWPFFALVTSGMLYMSILPFLRNPLHIAIAFSIFMIFALNFIAAELFNDFGPQLSRTAQRFSNFIRNHARLIRSTLRRRWPFFSLLAAGSLYLSILPALRNPFHLSLSIAAWFLLLCGLQLIANSVFQFIPNRPRSTSRSMRFSAFRQSQVSGKLTNLTAKEKPDMDNPYDYDKLRAQCEVVNKELTCASQNGHLDPLGMTEESERMILHAVHELSNVCSKVIVYMNGMKETRKQLFT